MLGGRATSLVMFDFGCPHAPACGKMTGRSGRPGPPHHDHRIMRIVMSCLIRFALAAFLAMLASAVPAQPYPTRPIRLLVRQDGERSAQGSAAGGTPPAIVARLRWQAQGVSVDRARPV